MGFNIIEQKFTALQKNTAFFLSQKDTRFLDLLHLKETESSLMELANIILSEKDTTKLTTQLIAFLANRWDKIAGSCFDYLSAPESGITELCLSIAQWLHQQDPRKKIYQYLMPTLTHCYDATDTFAENIDDLPLTGVILSDDKTSLIPINLLAEFKIDLEVNHYLWHKPYIKQKGEKQIALSEKEIQALFNHSTITQAIKEHADRIREYTIKSPTIGGELARLADGLFKGSVLQKGAELLAAPEATEAIATFMDYWHSLSKKTQEKFYFIQAAGQSTCLIDILLLLNRHIHVRRRNDKTKITKLKPTDGLLCSKTNFDKLQAILTSNPQLYGEFPESIGYLKNLENSFENLKLVLPQTKGNQKNPPTLQSISNIQEKLPWLKEHNLIKLFKDIGSELSLLFCQIPGFLSKEKLIKKNSSGETVLHWAIKNNRIEIVKAILKNNADTDFLSIQTEMDYTAVMLAVELDFVACLKAILEKNASKELLNVQKEDGYTALMIAARQGQTGCIKAIIDQNPSDDIVKIQDQYGETALMIAMSYSNIECVRTLLDKNASDAFLKIQTKNGKTALMKAVKMNKISYLEAILNKNSSDDLLNIQDNEGETALMIAIRDSNKNYVNAILDKNASESSLKIQNKYGCTALMIAAHLNRTDCLKAIFDRNTSRNLLNIPNNGGIVALMAAIFHGAIDCANAILYHTHPEDLLQYRDELGNTALGAAADNDLLDCVKAILDKNAYSKLIPPQDWFNQYSAKIREQFLFVLNNPFLLLLQYFISTNEVCFSFWKNNVTEQLDKFINLYQALYSAYQTGNLKTVIDFLKNNYCSSDGTENTFHKMLNTIFSLDEKTLALHFKRFIDEVKYTSQEKDLSSKTRDIVTRLLATQVSNPQAVPINNNILTI